MPDPSLQSAADPYAKLPSELAELPRWVLWRCENRHGKPAKIPYDAKSGQKASSTNAATWSEYGAAIASLDADYKGFGCVIAPPYVGVDLDKCRDPENGQVEPWAQAIIKEVDSYTELSPSGRGVHIWVEGSLSAGGNRKGRVEMYDHGRYFTVTGEHVEGTPLTINKRDLSSLQSRLKNLDPANRKPPQSVTQPVRGAANYESLMAGDWNGAYPSQSEADIALCVMLAKRHDCNPSEIDKEFRGSGLYRDKWERRDYRDRTIQKAIELVGCPETGQQQHEFQEARAGSGGSPPIDDTIDWRSTFKSYDQMERGELEFLISDFLPRGVTFIGGLPGAGKTWFALSLVKALVTGVPSSGATPSLLASLYST